jgi:hypothetical protein
MPLEDKFADIQGLPPESGVAMSENENVVEWHGCIVCGKLFSILAIHTPDGSLVDWIVTSLGGHRVPGKRRPLVACDTHPAEKIEAAYKRWQARMSKASDADYGDA